MDVIYGVSLIGRVIVTAIVGRSLVVVVPSVRNSSLVVLPFFLCPLPAQEEIEKGAKDIHPARHGCQMAIARFLDRMCMALRASGLWLRYATLQNWIPSFPWIVPGWRAWGAILPSGNLAARPHERMVGPNNRARGGCAMLIECLDTHCFVTKKNM